VVKSELFETGSEMTELSPLIEQIREFALTNAPPAVLERTVAISIAFLVLGIGLSVLGAKLAKPAMATALGLLGAAGGAFYAQHAGFNQIIGALAGAAMFSLVAHLTFRIWVGVATAAVLSSLALGTFGFQHVAPHLAEFDGMVTWSPTEGSQTFAVPTPDEQTAYREHNLNEWAGEFWSFATARDGALPINTQLVGFGAAAAGLFLGVVLVRWMLILATSVAGTMLVTTAAATVLSRFLAESYQPLLNHSGVMGMVVGAFFVSSLIIQTLLTRKARESGQEAKGNS
jgi:hypothetical protein